jgi:hypothetical protein
MCLRGASEVERTVLSRNESTNLAAFIVWVPQLHGTRPDAVQSSRTIDDRRTRHYWDGSYVSGPAFERTLHIDEPAWDVYLAYAPGIRWTAELPPQPTYWMHQLGVTNAPRLDGKVFAEHVRALTTQATLR